MKALGQPLARPSAPGARIDLPASGLIHELPDGTYLWAYRDNTDRIVCGNSPTAEAAGAAMARSRTERFIRPPAR